MQHTNFVSLDLRRTYDRRSGRRPRPRKSVSQRAQCFMLTHTSLGVANRKVARHDMEILDEAAVTLLVPNDVVFLRTIRLVVASLAADMQYNFEEIEDLRIVADELAYLAMSVSIPGGLIRIVSKLGTSTLELSASGVAKGTVDVQALDPMSTRLLSELVSNMKARIVEDRCEISLVCFAPAKTDR
jgi:hypothetical protein